LVSVVVSGPSAAGPLRVLRELKAELPGDGIELLGPAPLLRLRGRHRAQLLAKTDNPRRVTGPAGRLLAAASPAMRRDGLAVSVDVDPQARG
jgi:primosomal protein N'